MPAKKASAKKSSRSSAKPPARRLGNARSAASLTAADVESILADFRGEALTIVYVHGIGPKPRPDVLKCQWDHALFGGDLGDRSRMAFWMNEAYHAFLETACETESEQWARGAGDTDLPAVAGASVVISAGLGGGFEFAEGSKEGMGSIAREIEAAATESLAGEGRSGDGGAYAAKVLPAPLPVRQWIARRVTRAFLRDVNDFLYRPERCAEMCERLRERLVDGGGPYVVIGHSQGSMIAYHVLRQLPRSFPVPLFLTIGSPLGLQEVRDRLPRLEGGRSLMMPPCVGQWVNVADRLDVVAARQRIAAFYPRSRRPVVQDFQMRNTERGANAHSGTGYLSIPQVRQLVDDTMVWDGAGLISPAYLSRDLSAEIERALPEQRLPVLVELLTEEGAGASYSGLDETRQRVLGWIEEQAAPALPELPADAGDEARRHAVAEAVDLESLHSYVAARLTRSELERMVAELALRREAVPALRNDSQGDAALWRVFLNLQKSELVWESSNQVHAPTGRRGYDADGRGIEWAVLDSGIDPRHPHFQTHGTLVASWDCVPRGEPASMPPEESSDATGHGTHVAGILAGAMPELGVEAVAPLARLHIYRVLGNDGSGRDATIIKALDHIHQINHQSSELRIHGVNLSLGGPFDPRSFGCGDTPLCKQLHRLWRQGVVVVVAAGNEGYREVAIPRGGVGLGELGSAGLTLGSSIADPANLEDGIAVGSVHRTRPHFYGVSHFSSRGPTADGRGKPDAVAPGERIRSCRSFHERDAPDRPLRSVPPDRLLELRARFYCDKSGTSMAAPHLSGVAAAFLSARREFIGHPDRLKRLLLEHCTDLARERSHQGAGVPNLVKMLLNT